MKKCAGYLLLSSVIALSACNDTQTKSSPTNSANVTGSRIAPGAPGDASVWAYSGKSGIGTSYEQYVNDAYATNDATGNVSKVWFSLAQGIVTETMYGLIHEAQIKEMEFYIQGDGFLDEEKRDTISHIEYLHTDAQGRPLSLAYKITNRDKEGKYEIEKHIFTDPERNTLMMEVTFHALAENITPYLYLNPHVANTGSGDKAWIADNGWHAQDGNTALTLMTDAQVVKSTTGFVGVSDGLAELAKTGTLTETYNSTGEQPGNVGITLQLPHLSNNTATWQFTLGFGDSVSESQSAAQQTLSEGATAVLAAFNGAGSAVGWEDYLASLPELNKLAAVSTDSGKLLYTSAMVLKAQEDKTHAGAFIASLSNPWGDSKSADKSQTGYKAVWPRDFYQVAMAMLALGDTQSPRVAFEYLHQVQVTNKTPGYSGTPGWFLQKTHVDGEVEWVGVQLDQTAMPIMLGWRLWKNGVMTDAEAIHWYQTMLKSAAEFLTHGGHVKIGWNDTDIVPPLTQQERWEEQGGYSPSTTAAIIAGLVCAADLATLAGDTTAADSYLQAADHYSAAVEDTMFTTQGSLDNAPANGRYYLRITQNSNPNDHAAIGGANGKTIPDESKVLDAGFLELVRYGVRPANDPYILDTLPELDDTTLPPDLRVKYSFSFPGVEGSFPGWRRYGLDGYGEDDESGLAYAAVNDQMSPGQRGRVWPFFTGERGHFELARAKTNNALSAAQSEKLRNTYVKAMELFANDGMMLPEQVWDGVGNNDKYDYVAGEGTDSATPLAWTHAEYIKLLRSFSDEKVWDRYPLVEERYGKSTTPTK